MEEDRIPRQGEIYYHFKDKPYQIISVATHSETGERMVVYQALYGDFGTYVRPLKMFLSEVDHEKYPEVKQKNRFELKSAREPQSEQFDAKNKEVLKNEEEKQLAEVSSKAVITQVETGTEEAKKPQEFEENLQEGSVNSILLEFLEASSYTRKLNVITGNMKHLNDRLINDMAVSLDCAVEEGPIEKRIQELIYCLKAMCRFEDRRLR